MKRLKYTFLLLCTAVVAMTSCSDSSDDLLAEIEQSVSPEEQDHGYSIGLTITLDAMGGRSVTPADDPLWEMENYIDPKKLRVLFFDKDDKFLFESKSRWVKQIETSNDNSRWYVSVPFFTYGNEEDWNWEEIKRKVKSEPFKIAILANRPQMEWCPNYDTLTNVQLGWFDNTGPHWGPADMGKRDVFDLHHCQRDPMYVGKNYDTNKVYAGFYDFVQGGNPEIDEPLMGATSSWVDYGTKDDGEKDPWGYRYFKKPDKSYPIPMYGIQQFQPLTDWAEGTTYNLTRASDKPVSLLRSVVKIELLLPKEPTFVILKYINVYARCEPMNVWTPTDQIWGEHNSNECEWETVWKYGTLSKRTDYTTDNSKNTIDKNGNWHQGATGTVEDCKEQYQNRMSWLYGIWAKEKGWDWNGQKVDLPKETEKGKYPQILNSCIQRNNFVNCEKVRAGYRDGYIRYVIYTGERNVNDPSKLDQLNAEGTVAYWHFGINNKVYSIPLAKNFPQNLTYKKVGSSGLSDDKAYSIHITPCTDGISGHDKEPTNAPASSNVMNQYFYAVQEMTNYQNMPIPLIRNHVYRFKIGDPNPNPQWHAKTRANDNNDSEGITVEVEDLYTKDITFK